MSLIWDNKDAQTILGKAITGAPVIGGYMLYDGAQWRGGSSDVASIEDDFQWTTNYSITTYTTSVGANAWDVNPSGANSSFTGSIDGDTNSFGYALMTAGNASGRYCEICFPLIIQTIPCASRPQMVVRVKLAQTDANFDCRLGFVSSNGFHSFGTPSRAICVEKVGADATWFAHCADGGTGTRSALGALSTNWATFAMRFITASSVGFKMASTFAGLASATEVVISTNVPASNTVIMGAGIDSLTTATKAMSIDYMNAVFTLTR